MIEKLEPWWITGLIDGEGCFHISLRREHYFMPMFKIELNIADGDILLAIQKYFDCGNINYSKPIIGIGKKYRGASVSYWITTKKGLLKLTNHLENYPLQSKKRKDYDLWLKGVKMYFTKEHLQEKNFSILNQIRDEMNQGKGIKSRLINLTLLTP